MFNGLFDVNVVVKLFAFVFACRMLCDVFSLSVICLLCQMPAFCSPLLFFASYSPSLVIYIRHDEKLVTLVVLFDLCPVGGILPSVWARQ